MIMDNKSSMLFNVHFFPVIAQSIFETVDGRRIHHLLPKTIPVTDYTITKERFSHIYIALIVACKLACAYIVCSQAVFINI